MAEVFIDLRDDEHHWNGEIGARILDRDSLTGTDIALRMREAEIVLTVTQAITLFDLLDGWLHGGPLNEVGAIENRLAEALKRTAELVDDRPLAARLTHGSQKLARILKAEIKTAGLRFRMANEVPEHLEQEPRRRQRATPPTDPTEESA